MTAALLALVLPSLAWAQEVEVKVKKEKKKHKISGYLQVFNKLRIDHDDNGTEPDVFRVQRARLEFRGEIVEHVRYDLEIDPRAPEVTGILRDAFIALDYIPYHRLRIGQQKTQFGYENPESSTRLYVVNRAEVSDNLARGVTLRDIGVGLLGFWPITPSFALEDAVTVVNGAGMNVQADDTAMKNVWGRVGGRYECVECGVVIRFGLSGAVGDQVEPVDPLDPMSVAYQFDFVRAGADVEVDHPWFFAAVEAIYGHDDAPAAVDASGDTGGGYVVAAGKTPWNLGPMARYDIFDTYQRFTAGAWYGAPRDAVRLLFNYEIIDDDGTRHDDRVYLWMQARF